MDRLDDALLADPVGPAKRRLTVGLARNEAERRAAQKLRWRVFAEELGARLATPEPGVDRDEFDAHCEHLLVRDGDEVVGTYRILSPKGAREVGAWYSEGEFDLRRLEAIRGRMAELGRSCIDARYRTGGVIALLWAAIARHVIARGYEYLCGCASMSALDGGAGAAEFFLGTSTAENMAPEQYRVHPLRPLPAALDADGGVEKTRVPPLLRGYLRCGAYVCGEPAWDPEFNTADFFMLLPVARLHERYARHFFGKAAA